MNQDILFPDIQSWDQKQQAVSFPAQQAGALITCWVSLDWLQQRASLQLENESDILATFSAHRFDLEELAEALIEDESFNDDGEIVIN
ncbi:DUF1488 domain-containing protein [Photobacterium sanctipauli]|uniref:DUF1488 domain-containing protein n=1 Tax=Photobacterium sanctipauli TaxID=1342794 RepID=A0A2T3NCC4_9GAMM|nr:DUF1488 domain-containing protein [Photobacterium sanctipauli]PSW11731.1 DUF1488 domain-containing protein [Photobacterium sanctipauli]